MSLQEIVVLIHSGEYGRAISFLGEVADEGRSPSERVEYCTWLADCYKRLNDLNTSGDWYLEAVKIIFSMQIDSRTKSERALPPCDKALECYRQDGDAADIFVVSRIRRYLVSVA